MSYSSKTAIEEAFIDFAQKWLPATPRFLDTVDVVVVCFDWPIPEPNFAEMAKKARVFSIFQQAAGSAEEDS